ncbi:hypothetical protein HPB52_005026 [Rhipicephalus sanguineus]|uniref:Uncharacterized protein n=1 Tax=Rhipicephalus sanguineus TaxID=34632 RepID=A0A9D4PE45_RHISA|nr:hypothetical protein HPB52_005026 [Rhipicephalus sanguineus]
MRRSLAHELTCPPVRGSPEQQQRARVVATAAAAMIAGNTIESGSAPGNATAARRPEVVVVQGLKRRGCEYIGQTPRNALKVFHGSTSGFRATFTFVCKMLILISLKLYFGFMLLRYIYWLPRMSVDGLPDALFEISEVILSLTADAGAESIWSNKSNLTLISTRYFEASEAEGGFEPGQGSLRSPSFWHDTLVRLLLFGHAMGGLSLYFASNMCSWMREDVVRDSSLEATLFFCLTLIAMTQIYIAMTTYTVFCLDGRRTIQCATEELQRTYQFISHDSLSRMHWKWEQCCRYLGDLSHNFLGFVCTWYTYLFARAVSLITLLCTTVFSANGAATTLTRQHLSVPMFELTYLVILGRLGQAQGDAAVTRRTTPGADLVQVKLRGRHPRRARRSWTQELTCPPARGSPEQQQRARVVATAMTAAITIESGSAPGNATAARRPEVVVVQGLKRRGCEYIGQTPRNALKVFHGSTSGFSATLTFVCKMLIMISLKLYFGFMLLRYIYWLPRKSMDNLPDALFEISEVILSLAADAGAESIWPYNSNLTLLATRYFEASEASEPGQASPRPTSFYHDTLVRLLLFGHAMGGLSLYFASNMCSWMREDVAQDSSLEATLFFCLTLLAMSQVYMAMTVYTVFCLDVRRTMQCATEELQRTYQFISHASLSRMHWKWEQCCRYLGDLSHNFLRFVCTWYCYLFVRTVYLITLLCTAVFSANGAATTLTRQQLSVPMFELTYLVILCAVSDKLKATLLSPFEQLQELTLSRPTSEVAIHIEVQRFMYRIRKYLTMTLFKLATWTKFALMTFGLVVLVLLVRVHVKKL